MRTSLLRATDLYPDADGTLLTRYAGVAIHSWWNLLHKEFPITNRNHYDLGICWYDEVLKKLREENVGNLEAAIAEYSSLYGSLLISPE